MSSIRLSSDVVRILLIGLTAGTLSGLLGIGGGLIIVPALMFAVLVPQRIATATSLAAVAPIAIVGSLLFGTSGSVALATALILAVCSVIGSQAGTRLLRRTPDVLLRRAFGLYLLATAIILVIR